MSNLLSQHTQKKTWGAMRSRMALVAFSVLTAGVVCTMVAYVPGMVVYWGQTRAVSARFAQSGDRVNDADRKVLAQTQSSLAQFAALVSATSSVTAVQALLATRPDGIVITHLSYTAGKPAVISVSGRASSPDVVSAYRVALASNSMFSTVSVPIGSLIGSSEGNFTMTLSGNF